MLNRFFGKDFHDHFHLVGISAFAVGLPTSKIILSLSSMLLILNLLLEADLSGYWSRLKSNRLFHLVLVYFFLHIIALAWTSNFDYAFNDLRIKLTLLVITLVLTVKPVKDQRTLLIPLSLFVATLLVTSVINMASFHELLGERNITDIRDLSLFGSHIRYGILIAVGCGICLHYLKQLNSSSKWLFLPVLLWFTYYTYYSQILSGIIALSIVLAVFVLMITFDRSRWMGYTSFAILLGLIVLPVFLLLQGTNTEPVKIDPNTLPLKTSSGNPYSHDLSPETFIDGKPVLANLCEKELKAEWEKRSNIPFDSLDRKGQSLRSTLIRYMTSKDLKKDSADFQRLSDSDVTFIENGIANYAETKNGLIARWEGLKFELNHSTDPNGHSLRQRIEYWKTAMHIIQENWLIGVGTGDVQDAFDRQYKRDGSALNKENRLRAHNSYLTSWISFGILGIASFLVMIFFFLKSSLNEKNFLPIMFILVSAVTFLFEDTLETQMGVSFFAFFYGLFIRPTKD